MLTIVEYGKDEYDFPALIVLGCFDAIHVGHRELLKKAKLQAKINGLDLGVMMFREGKSGKLLYSFEERCAILEEYNVKFVLAVDFNEEFKAVAPLDFLHAVEDKINVKAYMSGKDFRFGAQAKGKSSTLKNYAEDDENGVWYMLVKDVVVDGEKVSTTLIKSCLDEGNVAKANELLGSEFALSGEVVKGEGRGTSEVGFPTVNIFYPEWKHPVKYGVYSVKCLIDGVDYQGIANFGNCPTFNDDRIALEVYFEGFSGDLYGRELTIRFVGYIRDIEQFGSAEELSEQLQTDLQTANGETAVTEEVVEEEQPEETVTEEVMEEPVQEEQPAEEEGFNEVVEIATEEVIEEEQPEETVTEEVMEEPVQEEQPAEEGFDEVVEMTTEEVVEEEQPEETATEEVAEEPVQEEQPAEEGFDEVVETTTEEVVEEEQPEETLTEEVTEEPVQEEQTVEEEGLDEVVEMTTEEVVEEEQLEETVTEEVAEEPVQEEQTVEEEGFDEVVETTTEEVVEEEQPEETLTEEVTEEPVQEEQTAEEGFDEVVETTTEEVIEEEQPEETLTEEVTEEPVQEQQTVEEDNGEQDS